MLINMLQSYLDIKIQADRNQQISGISEKLKKLSDNNYAQTHQVQVLENIAKTVHEVKNQLNRYKTTLIKDNKSKSKSSLNSLIESLKPIEKGLDSLVSTIAAL
jgi:archaellum component FlaC